MFLTNIYLVSTQKCRLNETVLLITQDIKPWLEIGPLRFCKRLHEFQKSSDATVKLISLKRKKEISIYALNDFN